LKAAARICKYLITCACAKSKPNAFTNGSSLRQTKVAGVDVCGHQLEHYITLGYPSRSWMHINTDSDHQMFYVVFVVAIWQHILIATLCQ
jgi:hypothetical protein